MSRAFTRRAFFGGTAAAVAAAHLPAGESVRPALAPEPPLPPGVCRRLGSARFRELTEGYRFTPDSRHLVQLDVNGRCVGYEVATGRRFGWQAAGVPVFSGFTNWVPTNHEIVNVELAAAVDPLTRYDLHTGRLLKTANVPNATLYVPTPDGTGVIGYNDGPKQGVLWRTDLRTGKTVWKRKWRVDASMPPVLGVVTGKWLVLVGRKRLHLFDPLTGEPGPALEDCPPKEMPPDDHFYPLNVSADGRRVAGWHTCDQPGRLVTWDMASGKVVGRLSPQEEVPSIALSPDGSHLLLTHGEQGRLVGMDVATGKVVRSFPAENVGPLLLSPDGKVLVAPHGESALPRPFGDNAADVISAGPVRLLDPATGRPLPQSPDPATDITTVRFAGPHALFTELHSAAWSRPTLAWDTRTGTARTLPHPRAKERVPQPFAPEVVLSPEGTRQLHSDTSGLVVTDVVSRRKLHAFRLPSDSEVLELKALWLTRGLVARLSLTALHVCDLATGRSRSHPLKFKENTRAGSVFASADGKTVVATGSSDDNAHKSFATWIDATTGTASSLPVPHNDWVGASADGRRLAVHEFDPTGGEGKVRVFDRNGRQFRLSVCPYLPQQFALSACGRTAAMAADVQTENDLDAVYAVRLVEVASGEVRATFRNGHVVNELAASPCGRRFATVSREAPVYLWDVYGEESDRKPKPDKAGLAAAWDALRGDAETAFAAVRLLVQHPAETTALLKEKLPPAVAIKPEWVQTRVARLGSDDFATRSAAERELSAVADRIAEQLKDAEADNAEADDRLERIRARAGRLTRERLREVRAVEVLEYAGADALLKALAAGAECVLTLEAKAAAGRRTA